jgi:siroheme synthase
MGISRVREISRELMEGGLPPKTPIAIIENGTTENQRVLITSRDKIQEEIEKHGIKNPAVIVVGEVALLTRKLRWYRCDKILEEL